MIFIPFDRANIEEIQEIGNFFFITLIRGIEINFGDIRKHGIIRFDLIQDNTASACFSVGETLKWR